MRLKSNGETMKATHKCTMAGYYKKISFSKKDIASIFAFSNAIQQYRHTNDRGKQMLVVRQESGDTPNLEFRIHGADCTILTPGSLLPLTLSLETREL